MQPTIPITMEKSFEFAQNVVGFMVKKEINQKKMEEILSELKNRLKVVQTIRLYVEIPQMGNIP